MPEQVIQPLTHPVAARITVPGSKSISNRALLLAALANGNSKLSGVLFSEDTETFIQALIDLGLKLKLDRQHCIVEIEGRGGQFLNRQASIFCKDAGTATRFLISACAAIAGNYHFSATARMSLPFNMRTEGLLGGVVEVDIEQSSQFLSGLLMAAPFAKMPLMLKSKQSLHQKSYVHMTVAMMLEFGIEVSWVDDNSLQVGNGHYQATDYQIEPDASTASYFFAMAALTCGKIHVAYLNKQSKQGDIQFLNLLEKMGCTVQEEQGGLTLMGSKVLKGLGDVDMTGYSDSFMTIAALAVFAEGPTTLHGLAHTRLQESDRIAAMADGLNRLGVKTRSTHDSLSIIPSLPYGARVSSYQDHRIAMSLSLIGLKVPGVIIEGAECVAKTCPSYFQLLKQVCQYP
ncbi:MAG: aroA [Gammaproteobacteria bacterium]|nr:aroA [Gammaproteobacteria bacterium]